MKKANRIINQIILTIALPGFIAGSIFFMVEYWTGDRYELYRAIQDNDIATVQELLSKNSYIVNEKREGITPLHEATFASKYQIAAILLKNGSNPNSKGGRGHYTPLFIAANLSDFKMMKILIDSGARIDIRDDRSKTIYDYAREDSKVDVIKFLDEHSKMNVKN